MVTHSRCPPGPLSRSAELFVSVLLRANRTRGQHDHFASDWRAVVEIDDLPHANAACPPNQTHRFAHALPLWWHATDQNRIRTKCIPVCWAADAQDDSESKTACNRSPSSSARSNSVSSDECSGSRPSPDDLGRTRSPGVKRPPCRQRELTNMRASMCSAIKPRCAQLG